MIVINRKLAYIELPKSCVYHMIVVKHDIEIVMKCSSHDIYAPITGTVMAFSSSQHQIKITSPIANATIQLPRTGPSSTVFYINQDENVVRGLKLAELDRQSGNVLIMSIHLNSTGRFKIEQGSN